MIIQLLGKKETEAVLVPKTATTNGDYAAWDYGADGFDVFTVEVPNGTETLTVTENNTYTPTSPNIGFSSVTVNVVPTIASLSITPSTSSQTFTPSGGTDGYGPVSVSAVDSGIDANIQAENIKDGVTILGVTGNYQGGPAPTIDPIRVTPTTSAQVITASGGTDGYSPITVDAVTSSIDSNIQASNIKSGVSILGVSGSVVELSGSTASVTPTTSQQVVTPTSPSNGLTSVTVDAVTSSIDANIQPSNIVSGATILGVAGTVQPAPAHYIKKEKSANGTLINSGDIIDFTGVTDISDYCLNNAYYQNDSISGVIDLSSLLRINGYFACYMAFYGCYNVTGVNMSSLTAINNSYACDSMFRSTSVSSVNLSSLATINGTSACENMFSYCSDLSISGLASLASINGATACLRMFAYCTSIRSFTFDSLSAVSSSGVCRQMFIGCSNLASLSFPALTSSSFGAYQNQFNGMLQDVTGCTVHFPSNLQSTIGSWADVINGFDGTNTTVSFDLPATE